MNNTIKEITTDLVVLGAGPGGYSAAFRAADLGQKVVLIERYKKIGGVCLNVGCIPSKALLHVAKLISENEEMAVHGLSFAKPDIDTTKLRNWKNNVIDKLTSGLSMLAKRRKVEVIQGVGKFINNLQIIVDTEQGQVMINFKNVIIAAGSSAISLPFLPEDKRIFNSTGALELNFIPKKMLVIGGGIIGLEMATVYSALGSKISFVEWLDQLIPGADIDLVKPLHKFIAKKCEAIMLKTKIVKVEAKSEGLLAYFEGENAPAEPVMFDGILVAVGRRPNGKNVGAENASVCIDANGFINVDKQMRTNIPNVYAIGDIIGNPMLAHKAVHEGRLAAEVISGKSCSFTAKCIPSVAYTDPEIAWVGYTEGQCQKLGISYSKGIFPWLASGRSLSIGRDEGITQLLFDKDEKIIGAGIVGTNAGELIGELALAIETGCTAHDIAETIHPHPTLSETTMMAAEAFLGTITDLFIPKRT